MQLNNSVFCIVHSAFVFLALLGGLVSYVRYGALNLEMPSGRIFVHGLVFSSVTSAGCGSGYLNVLQLLCVIMMLPAIVMRYFEAKIVSLVLTEYAITLLYAGSFVVVCLMGIFCFESDFSTGSAMSGGAMASLDVMLVFSAGCLLFIIWQVFCCALKVKKFKRD